MKSRHVVAVLALAAPRLAVADSHKLLVLQSEGRASAGARAKLDAALVKLARTREPQAAAGELNFTDAATAVGCKPDAASCKDEVLGMLGVDEIVTVRVTAKPGGLEIEAHRFARGGAVRDARAFVATGASPDKLDGIAPLFGPASPPPAPPPPAAIRSAPAPATAEPAPIAAPPAAAAEEPPPDIITILPSQQAVSPPMDLAHRRTYEVAGMATGGGLIVLGLAMWVAASRTQSNINSAPTATTQDLEHLKTLESRGDIYAGVGNVFAVTGLVIGTVATYLYVRDRNAGPAAVARLTPTVLDHGAGLMLTFGGAP
jgi:hypothetical protein